ncbi:hypothetical protein ACWEO2_44140 [Nocardia sp. NPDC004278]
MKDHAPQDYRRCAVLALALAATTAVTGLSRTAAPNAAAPTDSLRYIERGSECGMGVQQRGRPLRADNLSQRAGERRMREPNSFDVLTGMATCDEHSEVDHHITQLRQRHRMSEPMQGFVDQAQGRGGTDADRREQGADGRRGVGMHGTLAGCAEPARH